MKDLSLRERSLLGSLVQGTLGGARVRTHDLNFFPERDEDISEQDGLCDRLGQQRPKSFRLLFRWGEV